MLERSVDVRKKRSLKGYAWGTDAALPRILPFALFMAFLMLNSLLQGLGTLSPALAPVCDVLALWLYPVRIAAVLAALCYAWPAYRESTGRAFAHGGEIGLAIGMGGLVYVAWVRMEWPWAMQGSTTGYNPFQAGVGLGMFLAAIRLFGAVVVVPIMEELFWRSWLIRYLVSPQFISIRLGMFTPLSCLVTMVLFGLEHHLWLAGMMAGLIYNCLLYTTGRLWPCILAHAVTNLLLGLQVLLTGEWRWW